MRRIMLVIAVVCLASVAAHARPLLTAWRAEAPPAIDGDLSDACWQEASPTSRFVLWGRDALPEAQTVARVCYDDERVYLAVEAMEPNLDPRLNMLDTVKADITERDGRVFRDDCVEIFIQPGRDAYYQLAVNSIGALYDAEITDASWDGEIEVAAQRGPTSYTFELAIDLDSIGGAPEGTWRMNFCRNRTAVEESSTWSGLQGAFHQPAQFGDVRFAPSGPTISDVRLQIAGDTVSLDANLTGQAPELSATVAAGDAASQQSSTTGTGRRSLGIPLPEGAAEVGQVGVTWELADGGTLYQRSVALPLRVEVGATTLAVGARDATVTAWLNGEETLDGGAGAAELDLGPGVNLLAMHAVAEGEAPSITPTISASGRTLPVRWLQRTDNPPGAWTEQFSTEGWNLAEDAIAWPDGAEQQWLLCAIYLGEPKPQLFPKMSTFYVPRGSRQLMRLYAHIPEGVPTEAYRMVVDAPSALIYRAVDAGGGAPPVVSEAASWTDSGTPMTRYHLDYETLPGEGMEISLRWADESNTTITYEPSLASGGTHDWRRMQMTVTPPDNATSVHPLIIKWQNRGITGTFWVDNLVFRRADSDENLLKMGTFDEPGWGNHSRLAPEGPDGSMCCKIVSTPETADRQQALWVDKEEVTPVEPGVEYVVEMDVKCEELVSPTAKPVVGLLFEAPEDLDEGALPLYTSMQTMGGAVTGISRRSTVEVLSPLRDVRPAAARITPCYNSSNISDPAVFDTWADNTWASGMTWIWGKSGTPIAQALLPRGMQVIYHLPWQGWNAVGTEMGEFIEDHPDLRAIDFDGEPERHRFCPTWFLSDDAADLRGMFTDWVTASVNAQDCSNVNWDLEQPVVDPPTFCTCERCMDAFRLREDVPDDAEITPGMLLDEYRDRWVDFRCRQNAEAAGILQEAVHSVDPELEFSVYSGYQSKRTREHYGVDWALMQPHIDIAIAGYGGSEEAVRATLEAMDGKPFMGGEMWYLSHLDDSRGRPRMQTWCNRLLRKFL
ncbi:MAG: carbohydrate-binding family 9-like protein, partial [Armatimonadota bacterium]